MRNPLAALRTRAESRRRATPVICDRCRAAGVRYLYVDDHGELAETRCVGHALPDVRPAVDLGHSSRLTVGDAEDRITEHSTPTWPRVSTSGGLTLGQLRQLTAGLPDAAQVQVEDTSRTGVIPGSVAVHLVTDAAVVPDSVDTDAVYLLIEPTT